jgi:hypothetical protein
MTPAMVIDTNVIEHVFDSVVNGDGHVERFFQKFTRQKKALCLDRPPDGQKSRILSEYQHRMQFHARQIDEHGQMTQWLRYIFVLADRIDTPVNLADALGRNVAQHMNRVQAERSDQIFVYVACRLDSVMVSNNTRHVTNLRPQLRRAARSVHSNNTDFVSSSDAEASM